MVACTYSHAPVTICPKLCIFTASRKIAKYDCNVTQHHITLYFYLELLMWHNWCGTIYMRLDREVLET